ncbi:hypothetical protein MASR2M70_20680 [Bacillota bacterium]
MLKEIITYKENLPINCSVMNLEDYPIHFHNDIEVVYVLKGKVRLKNGYYNYEMKEGDVYILNDREIHSYYNMGEANGVLILQLSLSYFSRYYETLKNSFFITDMGDVQDESFEELKELLARIALENMDARRGYEKRVISLTHNLINCLMSNFQYFAMEDGKFVNETKKKGNKVLAGRLNRITEYMYENYSRRLTLSEIADREHLSIYYLSHFIKEATGMSFQELLSFIRVEESEKLLLGTDKKIGEVSVESGFSAVRYYIKYFTKWFGMHPAEYRKEYAGLVKGRDTSAKFTLLPDDEVEGLLCKHVEDIFIVTRQNKAEVVSVEFDTEEYVWKDNDSFELFNLIMKRDFMKPISELADRIDLKPEHTIAEGRGYCILRSFTEERGAARPFYSILLYNFSGALLNSKPEHMSQSRIIEELKKYEGQIEYYIKLSGLNGPFRISSCKFSAAAIMARYRRGIEKPGIPDKRLELANSWIRSPSLSVNELTVSQVLGIQAQHQGSTMELILIDPA